MRRILIALGIGAAVLVLLGAAVLLLVDVNKYNGVIQSRLEQQLRRKVTLGRMSLGVVPLRFQVLSPTALQLRTTRTSTRVGGADGADTDRANRSPSCTRGGRTRRTGWRPSASPLPSQ